MLQIKRTFRDLSTKCYVFGPWLEQTNYKSFMGQLGKYEHLWLDDIKELLIF